MKVSPTSSSLTTKVLIAVIVSALCVCGLSMRYMAPSDKTISMGWFANAVVGEGSEEAAEASVKEYFNAVNNKDYDKAFTYVIDQAKANPTEKQKWIESMKNGPKVDVVSLGVSQVSRVGNLKRITFEANLQMTKPGDGAVEATHTKRYISLIEENGAWHIEGFYKKDPNDR